MNVSVEIKDITPKNRNEKFQKAIKAISEKLGIPATIEPKESHKEDFPYQAQEDLYNQFIAKLGLMMDDLYSRVCSTLGMRPANTFKKAIDPNAPKLGKGEILWNPETGQPISQKDIDRLLKEIDKFMNRNVGNLKKEFTISESAVARILANLRKISTAEELRKKRLEELKYKAKPVDYFNSYGKLEDVFPGNYDRLKFRERVVGNYITGVTDKTRDGIRDILDEGFLAGKTKGEISQELFYKFGSLNKDWDRIIDTEATNIFNAEYIDEQKKTAEPGEPLYFIRREFNDDRTCSFCQQANDDKVIARWSDIPLSNDKIKDPVASIAIWDGKTNAGRSRKDWWWCAGSNHPHCRGSWDRFYPEFGDIEL
ncbi:MAG: hypothetical protein PQJ59_16990 [Spirochaetales bacterium]|nr:hypothetical protein [Spirochaetales bacterium]